jgi:Ribosomal RNA adenine dimethylase
LLLILASAWSDKRIMFRITGLRQWKSFTSVRWVSSDSHNSRLLKKPKRRPLKITTENVGTNGIDNHEGTFSTRESTESSRETTQEAFDASLELKNKYEADKVTPFLLPRRGGKDPREPSNRPRAKLTFSKKKDEDDDERDRPFTLPSGKFKPIQSLGQNFLSDQNYVLKICDAFNDDSLDGKNVVEIGPGPGALTRVLYPRYPKMTAIEIDRRAVDFLFEKLPG